MPILFYGYCGKERLMNGGNRFLLWNSLTSSNHAPFCTLHVSNTRRGQMIPSGIDIGTQSVYVGCYGESRSSMGKKSIEIALDRFSKRRILSPSLLLLIP